MTPILLDIAHPILLDTRTLSDYLSAAETQWGRNVGGVVFPLTTGTGTTFQSVIAPNGLTRGGEDALLPSLDDISLTLKDTDIDLWISLSPGLDFLQTGAVQKKSFQGAAIGECCIVSPGTQRATDLIIEEALDLIESVGGKKPVGIVIPVQDLWGMSAEDDILELTCFCVYCREQLESRGVDLSQFRGHPNPWNLVLKDNISGIGSIDSFSRSSTPEDLLDLSLEKQFYAYESLQAAERRAADEEEFVRLKSETLDMLLSWSARLKGYVDAMSEITKSALYRLFTLPRSRDLRCALVIGSSKYEWSTRMYRDDFDNPDFADEIWIEPSNEHGLFEKVDYRFYLHKRGRYLVDQFFEIADALRSNRARVLMGLTDERLKVQLARRGELAVQSLYHSRLDIEVLPLEGGVGIVIPQLSQRLVEEIGRSYFGDRWGADGGEVSDSVDALMRLQALLGGDSE